MSATNDPSPCSESEVRLEDDVRGVLGGVQGCDRYATAASSSALPLISLLERIASSAFEIVTRVNKDHFTSVVHHGSFADLTVCITDFCKVSKYQKISLLAIGMLRDLIPTMLESPECGFQHSDHSATDDPMIKYWFPVLFGFYDVIMNGEDLEVRRLCVLPSSQKHCRASLTAKQCTRLPVQHAQEVWVYIPGRVLGYRLPGAPFPHFRSAQVESRCLALQHAGRHECLAIDNNDPSS